MAVIPKGQIPDEAYEWLLAEKGKTRKSVRRIILAAILSYKLLGPTARTAVLRCAHAVEKGKVEFKTFGKK